MGQVWVAHDLILDRPVAIKFIAQIEPDLAAQQRFVTEARAVARLVHPNVVSVYAVGEIEGHPYLVSELVRGQSIDKLCKPLPWAEAHRIGLDLARGLAMAHRRGVLHRDIKPANAIISDEGAVKLLDFGLAKLLERGQIEPDSGSAPPASQPRLSQPELPQTDIVAALTARGTMLGTPLYMAPEVWERLPATTESDVYSLGVLIYELCTGRTPHLGSTLEELRRRVLAATPRSVLDYAPGVEPRLAEIIMRCLAQDPAQRFRTAEGLVHALSQITPRAALALPPGNPYRGLAAFQAEHRALFFGREADIETAVERLRTEPLLVLAGDSGVGKSSLGYAGVLPRIEEGSLEGERRFVCTSVLPGPDPMRTLAGALAPHLQLDPDRAMELARSAPAELSRRLQERLGERQGLLVFVDQMEELVTLSEPTSALQAASLLAHLAGRWPGVRVLATVRGDFLSRTAALPELGSMLVAHLQLVLPLAPEALREIVQEPARRKGFTFAPPEMVEEIVGSMPGDSGLPLLQFALAQLWDLRDPERRTITRQALHRLGGVHGALSRHADQVLSALLPAQRSAARRLLCKLVTAEDTKLRRRESELFIGDPAEAPALAALVRGRLVVARGGAEDSQYELAHEALIRDWPQLREWLTAEGERRAVRQRLEQSAQEWARLGHTRDSLWSNAQLLEVRTIGLDEALLGERERAFLRAGLAAQVRRRRLRAAALSLLPVIVLSLAFLGLLSRRSRREADRAQDFAQRESGLRAYSLALQTGREREALLGAVKTAELSLQGGRKPLQPAALTALKAAVHVGRQSMPLVGHGTAVRWAAFSADGKRAVTVGESEESRLWETETGRLLAVLGRPSIAFSYDACFSPDGRYVIIPLLNGETQIWLSESGRLLASLNGNTGAVSHVAVSADSRRLFTASGLSARARPVVQVWDLDTQKLLRTIEAHAGPVDWIELSPDSRYILSASRDHTAKIHDADTGRLVLRLSGHSHWLNMATYSPDGKLILTVSSDRTARLWSMPEGSVRAVLRGHSDTLFWGGFSPDGTRALTTSLDGTIRVWNTADGSLVHTLAQHNALVHTAVVSSDGRRIISAGDDHRIRIWSMQTGQELSSLPGHDAPVLFAFLSKGDGHILSGAMDGSVRLWSGENGTQLNTLRGSVEYFELIFSADGRYLAADGMMTASQRIWDARTGSPVSQLIGHDETSMIVALSPSGSRAVTVGLRHPDTSARLWNPQDGRQLSLLLPGGATFNTVESSTDGMWIIAVDDSGSAHVFDGRTGRELYSYPFPFGSPRLVRLSADRKYLAVSFGDGNLLVVNPTSGEPYWRAGRVGPLGCMAFTPNGEWLLAVDASSVLRRWRVGDFRDLPAAHRPVDGRLIMISRDSRRLATLGGDGNYAAIFDVATGQLLRKLEGHTNLLMDARFSPDSRRLVTASYDRTARIWDVETGQTLVKLIGHTAFLNAASFSPDGARVATASGDGTVRLWDAATGELVRPRDSGSLLAPVTPLPERAGGEDVASAPVDTAIPLLRTACRLLRYQPEYQQIETTCRPYLL